MRRNAWGLVLPVLLALPTVALAQRSDEEDPPRPRREPGEPRGPRPEDGPPGPGGPGGEDSPERRRELRKRIGAIRMARLTQELELDEATAAKLFPALNRHDEKLSQLAEERGQLMRRLGHAIGGGPGRPGGPPPGGREGPPRGEGRDGPPPRGEGRDGPPPRGEGRDGPPPRGGEGRGEPRSEEKPDVGALLDKIAELEKSIHAEEEAWSKKLREILTAKQAGQFIIFNERFHEEVRQLLRDSGGPGRGPDGRGPDGRGPEGRGGEGRGDLRPEEVAEKAQQLLAALEKARNGGQKREAAEIMEQIRRVCGFLRRSSDESVREKADAIEKRAHDLMSD